MASGTEVVDSPSQMAGDRTTLTAELNTVRTTWAAQKEQVRNFMRGIRTSHDIRPDRITTRLRKLGLPDYSVGATKARAEMALSDWNPEFYNERGLTVKLGELREAQTKWLRDARTELVKWSVEGYFPPSELTPLLTEMHWEPPHTIRTVEMSVSAQLTMENTDGGNTVVEDDLRDALVAFLEGRGYTLNTDHVEPINVHTYTATVTR
jgi:hypothetical protein